MTVAGWYSSSVRDSARRPTLMTDWAAPGTSMKYSPARSSDQTGAAGRAGAAPSGRQRVASEASGAVASVGETAPATRNAAAPGTSAEAW